ncbi:MAG: PAS domain-containing sensor histidine kinase [Flavobacteriales bacterium]
MVSWIDVWSDPTVVFNQEGGVIYSNPPAVHLFTNEGEAEIESLGKKIIHSGDFKPFHWTQKDNQVEYSVHSGEVNGCIYATLKDARSVDEIRAALNYNQLLYSGLANGTIEGLALINNESTLDCNAQMFDVMGVHSLQELKSVNWEKQLGSRNWRRLLLKLEERVEFEFVNCSGRTMVVEGKLSQIKDGTKHFALALLDITNSKRISKDLLQTKERFRLLVETNPFGLFLIVQGKVRYSNQAGLEILGLQEEEEVFDQAILEFFSVSDRQPLMEDMEKILSGEKTSYMEVQLEKAGLVTKDVGVQMVLSFFDNQPAVQMTINDLSTQMQLVREQMRRTAVEESNELLKAEITQHQRTQKQLERAERFNRSIIESSIDMIMAFDGEGRIIQFNHAASVEFGLTSEDALKLNAQNLLHEPDDFKSIQKDLREKRYYAGEVPGIRSTGEVFQMLISIATLQNEDGEGAGFVLVGRDITDIRLAEQELRSSEERYRDILENASDLVFLANAAGVIEYANPAFFKTLGHSGKTLRTTTIQDIVQPPPGKQKEHWMEWLAGDNNELVFKHQNGELLKMLGGGSVQRNPKGKETGLRCIYLNISEVRAYQKDAKEKSAKLQSIFNSTRYLLMFTIDKSFKVTSVNQNLTRVLNDQFGFETIVGTPIIEVLKEFTSEEFYKGQFQLFIRAAQGVQQQFELPLVNQSGEVVWYQLFVNPVQYDEGTEELSCIAYDITERKEIDNQIREALKEKEILLQEVHHRVKNNLQVISSMLNLQRRFVDDSKMLEILEESQNRISTMSFIHESLYRNSDFSSIGFSEYLERLTQNLIHSYSNVSARVELVSNLDDVRINLKQAIPCGLIVNELVSNSLKYAFKGRESGKIFLRVEMKRDKLEIEVADNGVGLPDNFDFSSNESLGVYLVQALTDQLDGILVVDNKHSDNTLEVHDGASFLVSFTPLTELETT